MDDDLDAFFDDVENAVKEVQEEEATKSNDSEPSATANEESPSVDNPTSSTQTKLQQHAEEDAADEHQRPVKRAKVVTASSGAVKNIIASLPVVSIAPPLPVGQPASLLCHQRLLLSLHNRRRLLLLLRIIIITTPIHNIMAVLQIIIIMQPHKLPPATTQQLPKNHMSVQQPDKHGPTPP